MYKRLWACLALYKFLKKQGYFPEHFSLECVVPVSRENLSLCSTVFIFRLNLLQMPNLPDLPQRFHP